MIFFNEQLYCSDSVSDEEQIIIANTSDGIKNKDIYCILLSTNEKNLFDILDINELLKPYYKDIQVHIIGLARGKDEAVVLAKDLLKEVFIKTGGFEVREYFG